MEFYAKRSLLVLCLVCSLVILYGCYEEVWEETNYPPPQLMEYVAVGTAETPELSMRILFNGNWLEPTLLEIVDGNLGVSVVSGASPGTFHLLVTIHLSLP